MAQPTSPSVDADPKCCPACKSDLRYRSPETYSEYEGWEFECNAIIIRNENGRLEVETGCSNATRNALSAPRATSPSVDAREALKALLDALPVGIVVTWGGLAIDHTKLNEAKQFAEAALSAPRVEPVADETRRQWIIALIRSEFDPKPAHYKPGDEWDDGAEAIADAILAAAPSQPDTERDDHCGYCSGPIARICEFHGCQLKSTSPPSSQLDTDPATVEGLKPTERWEVGKNGWDADCEATREDI